MTFHFEDGADGKPQAVLPGAERTTFTPQADAVILEWRKMIRGRSAKPQKACDHGLFSDEANQQEMFK